MTSGQAWVQQPENALNVTSSPEFEHIAAADRESLALVQTAEPTVAQSGSPPRHRLDHVVSLGEAAPGAPASSVSVGAGLASSPAPVVVYIVNYAAPSYAHGRRYSRPRSTPSSHHRAPVVDATRVQPVATAKGTPRLAGEGQAQRVQGTTFPYRAAPASL